ncbi:MAG: 5'/3'-nucleotidase SurE [Nitrospirales bacterium]
MNILVTNDDGPEAHGLAVLRRAAKAVYPDAKIVTLSPKRGQGGQGLAITPLAPEELEVEQIEPDFYVCEGTPADLIYLGLGLPRRFLGSGQFDLVLTGVNHGHNVGMDVFHSGTVGMAMLATAFFSVTAMAFSQQMEYGPTRLSEAPFGVAATYLPFFLEGITHQADFCHNVNFPSRHPKGQRVCGVSMFSRFRPHLVPLNKREGEDVAQLEQGYITISRLRPKTLTGNAQDHDATRIRGEGQPAPSIR